MISRTVFRVVQRTKNATKLFASQQRMFRAPILARGIFDTKTQPMQEKGFMLNSNPSDKVKQLVTSGQIDEARQVFNATEISKRDVEMYKALIEGYASVGNMQDAQQLFQHFLVSGVEPDKDIYRAMISGYSRVGMTENAWILFQDTLNKGVEPDLATYNALLEGFGLTSQIDQAQKLFESMPEKDIITWNIMINSYLKVNNIQKAKELYDQKQTKFKIQPDRLLSKKMEAALKGPFNK
jgi:pentatricopeptide repeat protein